MESTPPRRVGFADDVRPAVPSSRSVRFADDVRDPAPAAPRGVQFATDDAIPRREGTTAAAKVTVTPSAVAGVLKAKVAVAPAANVGVLKAEFTNDGGKMYFVEHTAKGDGAWVRQPLFSVYFFRVMVCQSRICPFHLTHESIVRFLLATIAMPHRSRHALLR